MADESLRQVAVALERLAINQASQGWARHLKAPDVFKPNGREAELKLWSDWKFLREGPGSIDGPQYGYGGRECGRQL